MRTLGPVPVSIDCLPVSTVINDPQGLCSGQPHRSGNIPQDIPVGDILAKGKIGTKHGIVKFGTLPALFSPLPQFLRQSAVVSHGPGTKRQPKFSGNLSKAIDHLGYVYLSAGKQILQRAAFRRRVRMQRKSNPPHIDTVSVLQFFNTPGSEITPRSDIIRKYV